MANMQRHTDGQKRRARWASVPMWLAPALWLPCIACGVRTELTPLSSGEIHDNGTLTLLAPRQTVLEACVLALRKQGFAIDIAEPGTGLVVTMREPEAPPGTGLFRAYVVEVQDLPGGQVQVSAWPAVSKPDMAGGARPYTARAWDVGHEREAWARLFEDVQGIVEKASR